MKPVLDDTIPGYTPLPGIAPILIQASIVKSPDPKLYAALLGALK